MWRKSYWMTGRRSHRLSWPLTSRSDVTRVQPQGGKGRSEQNYRWARRAFSSGGQTHLPLLGEARWAIVPLHGKAFCLMRERVNTFAGTCGTAAAEMSIWKWWKHSSITWLRIQLSASLLSNNFHSVQLGMKGPERDLPHVSFSWHSQLTLGFRLDVSVVKCNRYSTNVPAALWHWREVVCHLWTVVPRGSCVTFTVQTQCNRVNNLGVSLGSLPASKSAAIFGWQQLPGLFCQALPEGNNAMCNRSYFVAFISQNSLKSHWKVQPVSRIFHKGTLSWNKNEYCRSVRWNLINSITHEMYYFRDSISPISKRLAR